MQLQDQVIPLPMAQRLKELGVKQESAMYDWAIISPDILGETWCHEIVYEHHPMAKHCEVIASAFTAEELSILLPDHIDMAGYKMLPGLYKAKQWVCTYGAFSLDLVPNFKAETLAGAIGAQLVHLLESNLITVQ